jgi:hypothetical protein
MIRNRSTTADTTTSDGNFNIAYSKMDNFKLRISLKGYQPFTTSDNEFSARTAEYNMGTISLQKIKADSVSASNLVTNSMTALHFLPTKGASTLFYAYNPRLKNMDRVPANYPIVYPRLPAFKTSKRIFKKRFKKDKKRNEPYIYTSSQDLHKHNNEDFMMPGNNTAAFAGNVIGDQNQLSDEQRFAIAEERENFFAAKVKKFVFVFFKWDGVNTPQILETQYKVHYYTDNVSGNVSLYSKCSNATYGYAPMKAAIYNIEVMDQRNNDKRVRISDDQVDPQVYFAKYDLFNSWIKIAIQVYD